MDPIEAIRKSIHERSEELAAEAREYIAATGKKLTDEGESEVDEGLLFESWALQKIAGLQLSLEDLHRRIQALPAIKRNK